MSVSILKHGCVYRNHMVIRCQNCGCFAEFRSIDEWEVKCPECFHKNNIAFLDNEEFEKLKEELKSKD